MEEVLWTLISIVGPLILLGLMLWLALVAWRRRKPGSDERAERATHDLYDEEERRRRAGTDDL
jgi:cytochrome c-type biogenesis protein CcmH/NrfF